MTGLAIRKATGWLLVVSVLTFTTVGPVAAQGTPSPTGLIAAESPPAAAPSSAAAPQGQADTPSGPSSDPRTTRARALFQVGLQLLNDGLFADALRSFQESAELVRRPRTLKNIAECFRGLGRHREARETFDAILREFPNEDPAWLLDVRRARTESAGKIATYTIVGLPAEATNVQVRVDGEIRDVAGPPYRVELDPGRRVVEVRAEGYQDFRWEDRVTEAEVMDIPVTLEPIPTGPSVIASPWFWIITGVVVAAGAGVAYYFLDRDAQLEGQSPVVVNL